MTERSLLVRCATLGSYCILGTDYPSARVFDSRRSALVTVVEEPQRSRLTNTSSAFATTLTSVALGTQARTGAATAKTKQQNKPAAVSDVADDELCVYYAAMGLSNGTVVLHNVTRDEAMDHIAVSETQHGLIAMVFEGNYLFCLSANGFLYVVDVARRQCVLRGRCQADATSLAVSASPRQPHQPTTQHLFRVLVSGPTMALYEVTLQTVSDGQGGQPQQVQRGGGGAVFRKLLSFASQGSRVDLSWLSPRAGSQAPGAAVPALTASAQEGTIRVWDVRESVSKTGTLPSSETAAHVASVLVARCRRTLLCGQRMANLSVLEGEESCFVAATTVTGSLLLWDLGRALLPGMAEATPIAPHYVFVSGADATATASSTTTTTTTTTRLLYGAMLQASEPANQEAGHVRLEHIRLVLLHGRFAVPRFSAVTVGALLDAHKVACDSMTPQQVRAQAAAAASRAALGFFHSASGSETQATQVVSLSPAPGMEGSAGDAGAEALAHGKPTTGSDAAFATADSVWLHQQQQLAAKAATTPVESFRAVQTYHAASMKDLPIKQLTLEERLRRLSNEAATAAAVKARYQALGKKDDASASAAAAAGQVTDEAAQDADELMDDAVAGAVTDRTHSASLGLATVPLYQALHAGDTAAVMELLSVAGRSPAGMKATVLSLQLPYVLQLLKVLSERLGIVSNRSTKSARTAGEDGATVGGGSASVSTRSPLLAWVDAIVRYRGMEMYAQQQQQQEASAATEAAQETTASVPLVSPPKDFLAPILHQYRSLCGQYDKLATLYGRMSIFNAVRPSERSSFVNRAPVGSANSNLELLRDGRQTRRAGKADAGAGSEAASKLHKLYGHGDVLLEDIAFPATFKEVRTYKGGSRVVRVRNHVTREKRQHAQVNSDRALLRRARQLAAEKDKSGGGLLDSDADAEEDDMMMNAMLEANDGELDLDALEDNMRLDSDDDDGDDDEEDAAFDEAEEDEEDDLQARKRHRQESSKGRKRIVSDVMLADDDLHNKEAHEDEAGDEQDAQELDSSDAEFSEGSDDDVHSDVLDFSDDEKGSSSSGSDDAGEAGSSGDDDDDDDNESSNGDENGSGDDGDDDDDGMGEDMKALIEEEGLESAADRRKHKRVRLD